MVKENLEKGLPARTLKFDTEKQSIVDHLFLLTSKPVLYAANISENDLQAPVKNPFIDELIDYAEREDSKVLIICAKIEEEIEQLDDEEKSEFLSELGLADSGLERFIKASYELLGLISFLTGNPKEVRAWTIKKGTKASQAAGKIHSDFEKGFIRAEVIAYDDLIKCGSYNIAKEKGLIRSEGKEYIIQDGDVILFRFNV